MAFGDIGYNICLLLDPFLSKIKLRFVRGFFLGGDKYMYLLPFIMSNIYLLRYRKLLTQMVRYKHDQNVKRGKIYYMDNLLYSHFFRGRGGEGWLGE